MISICLCDDSNIILRKYSELFEKIAQKNSIMINITTFSNGNDLISYLQESFNRFDILFLDILMGKTSGLDVASKIREMNIDCEIIFLTSSEEYVFDSFDFAPLSYIIKNDFTEDRAETVFLTACREIEKKVNEFFVCKNGTVTKNIPLADISHFEGNGRIVTVYYKDESFDFYYKMNDLESALADKGFVRIHRSYIVNLKYIATLSKNEIELLDGFRISIGKVYQKKVKAEFSKHLVSGF